MKNIKHTVLVATMTLAIALVSPLTSLAGSYDAFVSGAIGFGTTDYDRSWSSGLSESYDIDKELVGQLRATASYQDQLGFGGQIDYLFTRNNYDETLYSAHDYSLQDIVGHLFYRRGSWLIGGFAQKQISDFHGTTDPESVDTHTVWGAEAQTQLGDSMSIYAQLGQQERDYPWGSSTDGWTGSVEGRYFFDDNLMANGKFTYGDMDLNGEFESGPWKSEYYNTNASLGSEYRLTDSMLSFFANYAYDRDTFKFSSGSGSEKDVMDSHTLMFGVKLNFGKDSLRQRDREGASLNPMKLHGIDFHLSD